MAASYGAAEPTQPGLERGAIGLTEVLFQSITHMAPAVATALSIGFATTLAGGITPLAVVFALIAALFTAYSIGQLARHLPSAGGMYTYVSRGLGSFAGWLIGFKSHRASPCGTITIINIVTETNRADDGKHLRITNLREMSLPAQPGDSGGPVYSGALAYGINTAIDPAISNHLIYSMIANVQLNTGTNVCTSSAC